MELGPTAYVILGMLRKEPRSGYEIKQQVDNSTRFFWAASYGQIYPELARLEELGLISGELDPSDRRRRKAYSLTPAGEEALHAWLTSSEPLHLELRHEGLLKLFFSDALSPDEQLEQVRRLRAEHQRMRDVLDAIEPGARAARDEHGHRFPYLTLEWGMGYEDFFLEWCDKAERRLAEEAAASRGTTPATAERS